MDLISTVSNLVDLCKIVRSAFDPTGQAECQEFILSLEIMESTLKSVKKVIGKKGLPDDKRSPLHKWVLLFGSNLREARRILDTCKFTTPVHVAYFNVSTRPRLEKIFIKCESRLQMVQSILAQPKETQHSLSNDPEVIGTIFGSAPSISRRYETEIGKLLDCIEVWRTMESMAMIQLSCVSFSQVEWWELLGATRIYTEKVKFKAKQRERTTSTEFHLVEFILDVTRILFLVRVMRGHPEYWHSTGTVKKIVETISRIYETWIPSQDDVITINELIIALRKEREVIPQEETQEQGIPFQEKIIAENLALQAEDQYGPVATLNLVSLEDGHGSLRLDTVTIIEGIRGNKDTSTEKIRIPASSSAFIPYFWWDNAYTHVGVRQGSGDDAHEFSFCFRERSDVLELQNVMCGISELASFDTNDVGMVAIDGALKFLRKYGSSSSESKSIEKVPSPSITRRFTSIFAAKANTPAENIHAPNNHCYYSASVKLWKIGRPTGPNQLLTPPESPRSTPSTSSTSSTVRRLSTPVRPCFDSALSRTSTHTQIQSLNRRHTAACPSLDSPRHSQLRPNSTFSAASGTSILSGTSIGTSNIYVQEGGRVEALDAKAPQVILLLCLRKSPEEKRSTYWMLNVERNWQITDCCRRGDANRHVVGFCEDYNCDLHMVTISSSDIRSQFVVTDGSPPAMSIGEDTHTHFMDGKDKIDAVRSVSIRFNSSEDKVRFSNNINDEIRKLKSQQFGSLADFKKLEKAERESRQAPKW